MKGFIVTFAILIATVSTKLSKFDNDKNNQKPLENRLIKEISPRIIGGDEVK